MICIIHIILRLILLRNGLSLLLYAIYYCLIEWLIFNNRYLLYGLFTIFDYFFRCLGYFFSFWRNLRFRNFWYSLDSLNLWFFNLTALFSRLVFKQRQVGRCLDIFSIRWCGYGYSIVWFQRWTDSTITSFQLSNFIHQHSLILNQMQSYLFPFHPWFLTRTDDLPCTLVWYYCLARGYRWFTHTILLQLLDCLLHCF